MTPNGAALRLYLLGLFEAQMNTEPGMPPVGLPLRGDGGRIGWTDLLATDAEAQERGAVAVGVTDKKVRQLHSALKRLAAPTVRLVHLPYLGRTTGKYELFQLLDEGGARGEGQNSPYVVPPAREQTVTLPADFFLNGWIHVLDDSEIVFLLMLAHERGQADALVKVNGFERLMHFGIGPDTYAKHRVLQRFGLVHTERDPERDERGRVRHPGDRLLLGSHQFRLLDEGFERSAIEVVREALCAG